MSTPRRYLRAIEQVQEDFFDGERVEPASVREQAIAEVLRGVPDEDYASLLTRSDSFIWFVPDENELGMLLAFPAAAAAEPEPSTLPGPEVGAQVGALEGLVAEGVELPKVKWRPYSLVFYLSPVLETLEPDDYDLVVGTVAYQLARILSGAARGYEERAQLSPDEVRVREQGAVDLASEWGFEAEMNKLEEVGAFARWSRRSGRKHDRRGGQGRTG